MSNILVIGDCHAPAMHRLYVPFLRDRYDWWQCTKVVHIGDVVDWECINYHEKDPRAPQAVVEYKAAMKQVQKLRKAFPKMTVMTGNHDDLPGRQSKTAGLDPDIFLKKPAELWDTPKWDWRPRHERLEIEGVLYAHGDVGSGGKYGYIRNAMENFQSYVQGHLHASMGIHFAATMKTRIFGMTVGSGADWRVRSQKYGEKFNRKPMMGCAVVIDGQYPILEPMDL